MGQENTPPRRVGLARIAGRPEFVVGNGDRAVPLSELLGDVAAPADTIELIERWPEIGPVIARAADLGADAGTSADELDWLAPITPRKLICVGANYHDHVAEMEAAGGPAPADVAFPYSFLKPSSSLIGSGQMVPVPAYGTELDWEVELAVVIGPGAKPGADARDMIFGYTVLNDLSLRDFVPFPHPLGLDALICKGFDGATPVGPWITPVEDLECRASLGLELRVNGEIRQDSSTAQMIFSVLELVEYYARVLTLETGDVIATGTPAGVGGGMRPPQFLVPGDEVAAEITGLGTLTTSIAPPLDKYSLDIHEGENS